jgi:hypothetical protein
VRWSQRKESCWGIFGLCERWEEQKSRERQEAQERVERERRDEEEEERILGPNQEHVRAYEEREYQRSVTGRLDAS